MSMIWLHSARFQASPNSTRAVDIASACAALMALANATSKTTDRTNIARPAPQIAVRWRIAADSVPSSR
jgi:hypothetical protein